MTRSMQRSMPRRPLCRTCSSGIACGASTTTPKEATLQPIRPVDSRRCHRSDCRLPARDHRRASAGAGNWPRALDDNMAGVERTYRLDGLALRIAGIGARTIACWIDAACGSGHGYDRDFCGHVYTRDADIPEPHLGRSEACLSLRLQFVLHVLLAGQAGQFIGEGEDRCPDKSFEEFSESYWQLPLHGSPTRSLTRSLDRILSLIAKIWKK